MGLSGGGVGPACQAAEGPDRSVRAVGGVGGEEGLATATWRVISDGVGGKASVPGDGTGTSGRSARGGSGRKEVSGVAAMGGAGATRSGVAGMAWLPPDDTAPRRGNGGAQVGVGNVGNKETGAATGPAGGGSTGAGAEPMRAGSIDPGGTSGGTETAAAKDKTLRSTALSP